MRKVAVSKQGDVMGPESFATVTRVRASPHSIRDLEVSASAVAPQRSERVM